MATSNVNDAPASKKIKLDDKNGDKRKDEHDDNLVKTLSDFKLERILSNNSNRKTICIQGSFPGKDGIALLIFEKKSFTDTEFNNDDGYLTGNSVLKCVFKNDVYYSYECFPDIMLSGLKTTVIYPATEKHIKKFSQQNIHLVNETIDLYNKITLPHIQKEQFSLDWVYNILDHNSETERIVFEDSDPNIGFILLPDLKWDGKTLETLYLVGIVHCRELKSLRDLNDSHLPLLRNIYTKGVKAIEDTYNLPESQLRIYLHYQPSFYHLHAHFTYLKYEAPGIFTEKSHMLTNVISNIELIGDYYQRVTLPFVVRENDSLFKKFETEKILKPCPN